MLPQCLTSKPSCGRRQVLEGEAKLDSWRSERTGFPEVVLGEGKSPEQIAAILRKMGSNDQVAMATRVAPQVCDQAAACLPRD